MKSTIYIKRLLSEKTWQFAVCTHRLTFQLKQKIRPSFLFFWIYLIFMFFSERIFFLNYTYKSHCNIQNNSSFHLSIQSQDNRLTYRILILCLCFSLRLILQGTVRLRHVHFWGKGTWGSVPIVHKRKCVSSYPHHLLHLLTFDMLSNDSMLMFQQDFCYLGTITFETWL